jgi:molybdenum cofactor guanylyltransferase
MKTCAVIIAGGQSARMGGREKAFLDLVGKPLLRHVIDRIGPQVGAVIINANGDSRRFAQFALPVIADEFAGLATPLAGLHAALRFAVANGFDTVLSVPSDTPFLPDDLVARLGDGTLPAVAASGGQSHFLTGLWPVAVSESLDRQMQDGLRRVKDFVAGTGARTVEWPCLPVDPFVNINTPQEFAAATREITALAAVPRKSAS